MTTPTSMVAAKRSVTIRGDLDSRIEARVGPRGYSAYVNKALDTQIQLDLLDEIIAASIADHGPVPDHVFDEIASDVQAARARRR